MSQTMDQYRVFEGDNYLRLMPKLRAECLAPASVADVMRAKLEALNSKDRAAQDFWLNLYSDDTGDGVAYSGNLVKVVLDAQPLRDINPNAKLRNGALILSPEEYGVLEEQEFLRAELEKAGIGKNLRKDRVKVHPVWLTLVRGDNQLLSDYADAVFANAKRRFGEDRAMGVWLASEQKQPTVRAWVVRNLNYGSYADGYNDLNNRARLLGVRAGGAAQKKSLDYKVIEALNGGRPFEFGEGIYVPVPKASGIRIK